MNKHFYFFFFDLQKWTNFQNQNPAPMKTLNFKNITFNHSRIKRKTWLKLDTLKLLCVYMYYVIYKINYQVKVIKMGPQIF